LSSITGVTLVPVTRVSSNHEYNIQPDWTKLVYGFHEISGENLRRLNEQHGTSYKYAPKSRIGYFNIARSYLDRRFGGSSKIVELTISGKAVIL